MIVRDDLPATPDWTPCCTSCGQRTGNHDCARSEADRLDRLGRKPLAEQAPDGLGTE